MIPAGARPSRSSRVSPTSATLGKMDLPRGGHGKARPWRRLAHAREGAALVEFSLAFPLLIILFLALVEFCEAFTVNRKLTLAASTVADLVAQMPAASAADLADIARVADALLAPRDATELGLVITSVEANAQGAGRVGWSFARGTGATAHAAGATFTLPAALAPPNSSVIVAETRYAFTPSIGFYITGVVTLRGRAYFRPRLSASVARID